MHIDNTLKLIHNATVTMPASGSCCGRSSRHDRLMAFSFLFPKEASLLFPSLPFSSSSLLFCSFLSFTMLHPVLSVYPQALGFSCWCPQALGGPDLNLTHQSLELDLPKPCGRLHAALKPDLIQILDSRFVKPDCYIVLLMFVTCCCTYRASHHI